MSHTMNIEEVHKHDNKKFHKLKDATEKNEKLVTPIANTLDNLIDISPPLASRHQKGERPMLNVPAQMSERSSLLGGRARRREEISGSSSSEDH